MSAHRNEPCPCGSGKKYKHCCMLQQQAAREIERQNAPTADDSAVLKVAARHIQAGRLAQAADICRQVLRVRPEHGEANHLLGLVAWRAGRLQDATGLLLKALRTNPKNPAYHANFAAIRGEQGEPGEALRAYGMALRFNPEAPALHYGAANQLMALGEYEDAVIAYDKVLAAQPEHGPALANRGTALLRLGRLDEAEQAVKRADELAPGAAAPQLTLAAIEQAKGALHEAERALREAILRDPDYGEAYLALGGLLPRLGRQAEAADALRTFLALQPMDATLAAQALDRLRWDPEVTPDSWLSAHRQWADLHAHKPLAPPAEEAPDGDTISLASIVPDVRTADARCRVLPLLIAWAEAHGPVTVYTATPDAGNAQAPGLDWQSVAGLDERALAERIAQDAPDLLLDVMGHQAVRQGAGVVPGLLRRPASRQWSWGYPGTLGMPGLYDGLVADGQLAPSGVEAMYDEPLARLQHGVLWVPEYSESVARSRDGTLRLLVPAPPEAISDQTLAVWRALQKSCAGAVLSVAHPGWANEQAVEALRVRASEAGIDATRLEIRAESFRSVLGLADIVLDPAPVSMGEVLVDAIAAGVPAVTLAGDAQIARTGAAYLVAAGRGDWVARSIEGYVDIVSNLAADSVGLNRLREELPGALEHAPVNDASGLARGLFEAVKQTQQ